MRFFVFMAVVCAALCGWAWYALAHGDPSAINGVIGAGFGVLTFSAAAWLTRDW